MLNELELYLGGGDLVHIWWSLKQMYSFDIHFQTTCDHLKPYLLDGFVQLQLDDNTHAIDIMVDKAKNYYAFY